MYRHSHSALALAAIAGGAFHPAGVNVIWAVVLASTIAGSAITVSHIAFGLGLAPHQLIAGLRRRLTFTDNTAANRQAHP